MAIIKCKMCGGDLEITAGQSVAECEYCGSKQTIPNADNEKKLTLFSRANRLRFACEFDKAAGVYEAIVAEFPTEAEAYWGLVLCKFGIEYVDDPGTGKKIPTCHRSSFDSVMEDSDLEQALENADAVARKVYREEAKAIEELRRDIIEVSGKEAPYDIFICYKETAEDGGRTLDSVLAQDVYDALTEKGYRVFFSRITLEDKLGQEYEPYIFAALNSAKIMLAFGTDYEYFNAIWVKNEWSRYLQLMTKDKTKHLIPCYKGLDAYDMPKEFAKLQAQDLGKVGATQDLLRGIEKLLPKEEKAAPAQQIVQQVVQTSGPNVQALLQRGNMALEDREWDKADGFFDQVLNMDAQCAEAYLGKALLDFRVRSLEELVQKLDASSRSVSPETKTAEKADTAKENALVQKYIIPGYLSEGNLRAMLAFDFSYQSFTSPWKNAQTEVNQKLNNRNLARAKQYATSEVLARITAAIDAIESSYRRKISESQARDEASAKEVMSRYATQIPAKLKAEWDKAQAQQAAVLEDAKQQMDKKCYAVAKGLLLRLALSDYRNSKELLAECEQQIALEQERIRAEKERIRAQHKAEKEAEQERQTALWKKRDRKIAAVVIFAIVVAVLLVLISKYTKEKEYYEQAKASYDNAVSLLESGDRAGAAVEFGGVTAYADTKWQFFGFIKRLEEEIADAQDKCFALWDEIAQRNTIAAGLDHTVGLKADGTVVAVGNDYYDQCDTSSWRDIVAIAAGRNHTVGLKADGSVVAVGEDNRTQCTTGDWTGIVAIAAGGDHTVGLKADGTVVAVGDNGSRQCNTADWTDIVAIAAGGDHTVGLKTDGTVVAVGDEGNGQCRTADWTNIVAIAAGGDHTVGLKADGTVVAVGDDDYDQCNIGDWTGIVAIAAGSRHTVGLKADGTVVAVGNDLDGQCNIGDWTGIVAIAAGDYCTVGLKADGTVVAVGNDDYDQCDVEGWTDIKVPDKATSP